MRKHDMQGLTTIPSNFGPKETMDRLETELRAQGIRFLRASIMQRGRLKRDFHSRAAGGHGAPAKN